MELIEFKNGDGDILRGIYTSAQSRTLVVFVHGFERSGMEMKYKNIVQMVYGEAHTFRFDFSGCGISGGSFEMMTTERLVEELHSAVISLKKKDSEIDTIVLVGHSFGGCVALQYAETYPEDIHKIAFLGPAFNQSVLQRFFWAIARQKGRKDKKIVTLDNLREIVSESDFLESLTEEKRMIKAHYLNNNYFRENSERDFQDIFNSITIPVSNMLVIHGDSDRAVPIESNDRLPEDMEVIRVRSGDHELERPDMVGRYLEKITKFILG